MKVAQCLNGAAGASRPAREFPLGRLHAIKSVFVHAHGASRNLYDFLDLQLGALAPCRQLRAIAAAYTASKPSQCNMHPMKPLPTCRQGRAFSEFLLVEATATLRLQFVYLDAGAGLCLKRNS
jgi:hypothetical protein